PPAPTAPAAGRAWPPEGHSQIGDRSRWDDGHAKQPQGEVQVVSPEVFRSPCRRGAEGRVLLFQLTKSAVAPPAPERTLGSQPNGESPRNDSEENQETHGSAAAESDQDF